MQVTIDANKKSWFSLDKKIKDYVKKGNNVQSNNKNKTGLLKRQDRMMSDNNELDTVSKYILAVREAFNDTKQI